MLKLEGQRIVADVVSLNQQSLVGLISSADLTADAQAAISSLTSGAINSLDTPVSGYASATQTFASNLTALAQSLSSSATTPLTPAEVGTTITVETEAYQADLHAGLQVLHPNISNAVDSAVTTLESTASAIAQDNASDAQSQLTGAISTFDTALLGTTGVFGPQGVIEESLANHQSFTPNQTIPQDGTNVGSISGTATQGDTATLTATLTSTSTGQGLSGATVSFTLDGAFAGIAVTNSSGVATLSGVTASNAVGTDTGGVVASFNGNINYEPSYGSGDLTVTQAATSLGSVSGTATGGVATLTATLTSAVTNDGIANETVSFTLDGTSIGTAVTDSSGIATLANISTSDSTGTYTGAVVANFSGDTNYSASNGTGTLTVTS